MKKLKLKNRWQKLAKQPLKLAIVIVLVLAILSTLAVLYKDWDNRRFINGISEDFPELVAEIEQATGMNLEISSDCMQTTEKFSEGVKLCGISIRESREESTNEILQQMIKAVENNKVFVKDDPYREKAGFIYNYMNKDACTVNYKERIFIDCTIAPRKANEKLALEKLNADYLNERKSFYKQQLQ